MKKNPALIFMGIGIEAVGLLLGGLYLGTWIDKTWNLAPWGTLILVVASMAGWLTHMILLLRQMNRQQTPPDLDQRP